MRQLDEKWTPAQRDAIRARGETLLVSAAAGSGKTAVLTERIIDRLLDEEGALDLSSVLVVTFTKAAAAELKARIRAALGRELAQNPDNRRLHTQLLNVGRAKICTIDSFCLELIRAHFDALGLSPKVNVSDEAEAKLLAKTVMNDLIDDYFDGMITDAAETIDAFGAFTDLFVTSRSLSALADVFLEIRETVNGYEEGVAWLGKQADLLLDTSADFFAGAHGKHLYETLFEWSASLCDTYASLCDFLNTDTVYMKNYGDCFSYERRWLSDLSDMLETGAEWDALRAHFMEFHAPGLKSGIRGDKKTEDVIYAKAQHDAFNTQRKEYTERFFTVSAEELAVMNGMQADVIRKLSVFLSVYERRLAKEKAQRQTLDFGDMGRLALQLLWDAEHACPTEIAHAEAAKYTEIYIDEYQDVSPVQDKIFSAIASEHNRFMVGDAKQSIYGFRGASPELFLGYRADFSACPQHGRTIFLSDNFRCDRHIIDYTNLIFSVLFGCGGTLPYTAEDALRCSKLAEGEAQQTKVQFALLAAESEEKNEEEDITQGTTVEEAAVVKENPALYTEADYVADRIEQLLQHGKKRDGTQIRPRDIVVLLRSAKTSAEPIARALEQKKIPSFNNVSRMFFENAEVLLMYSLLCVIDNPQKDVYLAGTLKSPLYRVTLDELIYMRKTYPDGSLYDALCRFSAETGFAKGQYFLERLQYYRHLSVGMPVDRFLWFLYQDTGILSLVYEKEKHALFSDSADSAQMRANLMMFYEYARSFERGSFQGLYQFVGFIGNVIEEKAQMPPVLLSGEDTDAVRIMTVHQSKGLEFPVCFLCGTGKRINEADLKKTVLLDRNAGIATYLRDETGLARIDHPVRECIRRAISIQQKEEEMRVLYVALTRAREQLYITASHKDPATLWEEMHALGGTDLSRATLLNASNTMTWMLQAAAVQKEAPDLPVEIIFPTREEFAVHTAEGTVCEETPAETISYRAAKRLIEERFSFVYPDVGKTKLPAKLSVSDIHRSGSTGDGTAVPAETPSFAKPRFLQTAETAHATAAERGTATHIFMQFCAYPALADDALPPAERLEGEIVRLRDKHFITEETASRIDRRTLVMFLESRLFACLRRAKSIHREVRFNLHVPAKDIFADAGTDALVLVQGIVDCYYVDENDRVILVDYKTDHFSREMLSDRNQVEAILRERHAGQLTYYRAAVEQMLCRPVSDVRIYSFALGDDFSVM